MNIAQLLFKRKYLLKLNKRRFKGAIKYLDKLIEDENREPCYLMGDIDCFEKGILTLKIPPIEITDKYEEDKKALFKKIYDDYSEKPEQTLIVLFGKIKADRLHSMYLSNKKLDKLIEKGGLEYYLNLSRNKD